MDDWHIGAGFRPVSYSLHGDKGFRNRAVTHPPQRAPQRADGHFPQSTRSEGPKQSAPALHLRIAPRNRLARGETVCESPHTTVCCITRAKLYNLLYMATNGHPLLAPCYALIVPMSYALPVGPWNHCPVLTCSVRTCLSFPAFLLTPGTGWPVRSTRHVRSSSIASLQES